MRSHGVQCLFACYYYLTAKCLPIIHTISFGNCGISYSILRGYVQKILPCASLIHPQ